MKWLALINAQVYYGTDCYYGRLFYIKVFNDLGKAREAVEKKCKKMGVDPKCFKDDECLSGWRSKPTYVYATMLHTEDWDEMKISETEKAEQLAASIIALDDEIGKYVAVSYSCFDGPDEPLFLGSDDDLEKAKAMAQKYVDEQYQEINKTFEDTYPIFEAKDIDKAWECCCAWVKNPTGINLIDGCEGVSHSAGVISIEEEKLV